MKKKIVLSIIIALCLISVSLIGVTFAKYFTTLEGGFDLSVLFRRYVEVDGSYQNTETYTLDENGNLTIKDIYYSELESKWYRVKGIAENGFNLPQNTTVKSVSISKTVKTIGANAFTGLQELETLIVADENTAFKVENDILFSSDGKTLVRYPSLKAGNYYTVPSTVTSIIDGAFSENSYCTAIVTNLYNETAWGSPAAVMINTTEFLDTITNITGNVENGYTVYLQNSLGYETVVLQGNDDPDNNFYGEPKDVEVEHNESGDNYVTIDSSLCTPCEDHNHYSEIYLSSWRKLAYAYLTNENVLEIHNCLTAIVGGEIYQWVSDNEEAHRVLPNSTLYNIPSGTVSGSNKLPATFSDWTDKKAEVLKVEVVDEIAPTSVSGWFKDMTACTEMKIEKLNTEHLTTMYGMFWGCESLLTLNVSHFNTSNVKSMSYMFARCLQLTSLDVSDFDTSIVTNMSYMFANSPTLTSITLNGSNFSTAEVTTMENMFAGCSELTELNLSHFDTAKVKNMARMFNLNHSLSNLILSSNFKTAIVTSMTYMFNECKSLTSLDLSSFDTSEVTNMDYMFRNNVLLTTIYATDKFVTTKVSSSSKMFENCTGLEGGNGTTLETVQATGVSAANSYKATYAKIDKDGQLGYFTQAPTA